MKNQLAPNTTATHHVFVTVAGGVAYMAKAPENVEVHIIDYDDLEADFELTFSRLSSEAQAFYLRTEEAAGNYSGAEQS